MSCGNGKPAVAVRNVRSILAEPHVHFVWVSSVCVRVCELQAELDIVGTWVGKHDFAARHGNIIITITSIARDWVSSGCVGRCLVRRVIKGPIITHCTTDPLRAVPRHELIQGAIPVALTCPKALRWPLRRCTGQRKAVHNVVQLHDPL